MGTTTGKQLAQNSIQQTTSPLHLLRPVFPPNVTQSVLRDCVQMVLRSNTMVSNWTIHNLSKMLESLSSGEEMSELGDVLQATLMKQGTKFTSSSLDGW